MPAEAVHTVADRDEIGRLPGELRGVLELGEVVRGSRYDTRQRRGEDGLRVLRSAVSLPVLVWATAASPALSLVPGAVSEPPTVATGADDAAALGAIPSVAVTFLKRWALCHVK